MCKHQNTKITKIAAFVNAVSIHPYTNENKAAHGNLTETEMCLSCGATRMLNVNQQHIEYSPWSESTEAKKTRLKLLEEKKAEQQKKMNKNPKTVMHKKYGQGRVIGTATGASVPALMIDFGHGVGIKQIITNSVEIK